MKHFQLIGVIGFITCLFSFSVALTSCSSDDEQEPSPDGRKLRQLTISEVPFTRATLTDNTTALAATWNAGDAATYFNLSSYDPANMDYGSLIASSGAATSAFTGTVRCTAGDNLALLYPAADPIISGDDRGKFPITLAGQDGTLGNIAAHFHYTYGVGTVTSVTDGTANATISSMRSLLAVCKFTFKDGGNNPIPVKTLQISYAMDDAEYGLSRLNYPLWGKVAPAVDAATVVAIPVEQREWVAPLSIDLGGETSGGVYVALFPVTGMLFHFAVTNSSGTYSGTATAKLNAGKYYPVTLKLTKE